MSFREWRIKVKSEELKWRVKSEEWRISYRGPKEDSENGAQAIRLKRNSSNSAETELKQFVWRQERKIKLMFN